MHGFSDDDYISFNEVHGMTELNNLSPIQIKVVSKFYFIKLVFYNFLEPHVFNIGNVAANFANYAEGGRARQVKMSKFVEFKPLKSAIKNPDFLTWDFANFDEPQQLHALWQALYKFEKKVINFFIIKYKVFF